MSVLLATVVTVVATAVVWLGSDMLEEASNQLAGHYGLPPVIQGSVVAAIGSSFPELSIAVLSVVIHDTFDLGVGAVVGSAVFNVLVIPGVSALLAEDELNANRDVVYKEALFYMLSVAALLLVFSLGVIYYPHESGRLVADIPPWLGMLPIALYGLYVFIQYADTVEYVAEPLTESVNVRRQWGSLLLSLALVLVAVEGFVYGADVFATTLGVPEAVWGLTVVAAATSLPDTLVSVRAARKGRGITSLGNVLGSNVFDLLVAVPAGIVLAGGAVVNYGVAVPMMAFLVVATVALFTMLRTDLHLSDREATVLLGVYAVFLSWMVLETVGAVGFVPGL
ncbi:MULTISPECIES: sodium:calcium antiporter [Halolamina]|uniref:Cation:H+ antiporter n=1 Tax=Halolamina pelagica TaxID=699431 RepID=A0A1I5MKV9_9EURY|nr:MULTISPECIES: sodium:calcium antiporter [Halolamina]NHX36050.1 sodium:calcium antiporter [Halolamina sp. R1-12]SFP09581.1 cation:H+ antiporter [Halolamina pelagica]